MASVLLKRDICILVVIQKACEIYGSGLIEGSNGVIVRVAKFPDQFAQGSMNALGDRRVGQLVFLCLHTKVSRFS